MAKKAKLRPKKYTENKKDNVRDVDSSSSEHSLSENNEMNDHQNSYAQRYHENLVLFRDLMLKSENKIILLQEQNLILKEEKKALLEEIQEYKDIHKKWSDEKKDLVIAVKRANQKVENVQQTKSFRLGYALIFGFKSWRGFKDMFGTFLSLYKERKAKKLTFTPEELALQEPQKRALTWDSQKPVFQWQKEVNQAYLADFTAIPLSTLSLDSNILLAKEEVVGSFDCTRCDQLVVRVNAFSKDKPDVPKQSLLTVKFYDENGGVVQPVIQLPFSKALDKHYFYLNSHENVQDYVFLLIPNKAVRLELGLALWDAQSQIFSKNYLEIATCVNGVSVILPTYKGEKTIIKCLESLAKQTLPISDFEVLIVINGEQDNTPHLIRQFRQKYPQMNLKTFELEEGNVSKARNYAVQQSTKAWITFIDDDDFVPENYLNSLYQNAMFNSISLTGIEDLIEGEFVRSSIMNQLDNASQKDEISYADVTSTLTMNACKLAPAYMVKDTTYNPMLRSGEDVVYWSQVLNRFHPKVTLVKTYAEDSYKRLVRNNSISRKAESYDFNVFQRLEVIKLLVDELKNSEYQNIERFIQSKIDAQSGFIKRYLQKYSQDYAAYLQDIAKLDLHNKFIGEVNSLFTDTLVVSYCFAPYIDTSGIVMSKRIQAMNKPVDIITNSMSNVRKVDRNLLKISEYYLGKQVELKAPQAFSNWNAIAKFADNALDAVHNMMKNRDIYQNLYSRAMWPASHIAAALVKNKYPTIRWTAEFSDPVLMDVSAKERYEEIPSDWLERYGFIKHGEKSSDKENLFYWCEKLAYLYADELVFTNENQLEYMLSYADEDLKDSIRHKAVILPQPTLDRRFYQLSNAKLDKEEGCFHLAYFGSFYVNRGFKPFVEAWSLLPKESKKRLKLHIYTQQGAESIMNEIPDDLKSQILVQGYVDYFDFLALADQFDGLVVMDAETKGLKFNNPYLPSKLSDYLGANSPILALTEQGSPMSQITNKRLLKADMHQSNEILQMVKSLLDTVHKKV